MIIFLDTEFTRLPDGDLISIGLVPVDSNYPSFYAENASFNKSHCSQWVKENVLTLLHHGDCSKTYMEIKNRLAEYLNELGYDFTFIADYEHDFHLLRQLFSDVEKNFNYRCVHVEHAIYDIALEQGYASLALRSKAVEKYCHGATQYFKANPESKQHNALDDARAHRQGWKECFKWLNKQTS